MNFKEIDELLLLVTELDELSVLPPDLSRFDLVQAKIVAVARDESLPLQFVRSISDIRSKPQKPYYLEVGDQARVESWKAGIVELRHALIFLISELRKTALIVTPEDLVSIVDMGLENQHFEFKSSLRWDISKLTVNVELEFVILKTIAAFSNSDGGNLLIGVDDDGNILGLEGDYATLKNPGGNWDEFERHVRNLISRHLGTQFSIHNVQICRIQIGDKEMCQIRVRKGSIPVVLEKKPKHGEKKEVFYFRLGNQSKDIEKLSEFYEFISERFISKLNEPQ